MQKIFDATFMISVVPEMLRYLPITLILTIISSGLGLLVGFSIALLRYFHVKGTIVLVKTYTSFIRGTPTMVQLLLVYYGTPILLRIINEKAGTNISVNGIPPLVFAAIAFSLNIGAYMSEIIRSALLAVDPGQLEASYSIGMSTTQAMRRIVIPQAFVIALPSLGNSFISMLKETSLVFNISVVEIMAQARIIGSRSFRFFEVYIVVSIIYWCCCILFERILAYWEKGMRKHERVRP